MKFLKIFISFLLLVSHVQAQEKPPFYNDIQTFKSIDSSAFPGTGKTLFVGSSSFTKWTDVQNYFPNIPIINRGFGGSTLTDLIRYANDVIIPYQPKQIVIYCGENDLAYADTVSAQMVLERFKTLFGIIRAIQPRVPIDYVSIKPSPSRARLMPKMVEANKLIKKFLKKKKHTAFINVYNAMLGSNGQPLPDIFIEDNLHMNAKGYAIWQKIIEPYINKN